MGKVYRARDVVLDVPVALKVVRPDLAADRRFRKLFDAEVRVAARFSHEHIVPLHDLGELGDGTPFLGLALADSGSFARLRESTDWDAMLRLMLELLDALSHLHSRGVLHRDLKPENVLLHRGGHGEPHVWLADLGLAKAATDLARRKGRSEGTPGFMAPEQRFGLARELGPWTDLFSVGVILWDLITGTLPFGEQLTPIDTDLPALVPRPGLALPEGIEVVLGNLLAAEPLSRYDLVADLERKLRVLGRASEAHADTLRARRADWSGALAGTVAPSAPRPTPPTTSLAGDEEEQVEPRSASSTWFPADEEAPDDDAPRWNRPLPVPLPKEPPAEAGYGGTARASLPLFALRELPLVAREPWRRALWEHARATAERKRPRVVLVVGEAGSGKTHLVESVVRELEEGGWAESVTLTWQRPAGSEDGYPGAARALLRPWNETRSSLESRLARWIAREHGARDDAARQEASLLARWCGLVEEGEPPVSPGVGLRGVYRFLDARAWRGLAVLVLDAVQWAVEEGDGLSIAEAVSHGVDEAGERPLLVIGTLRGEDLAEDRDLARRVQMLERAGAHRIDLPRLDRDGTAALLAESLTLAPDLAERVASRCEGNPLFARQLLLEWANRGWLVDTGGLRFGLAPGVDADAVMPADAEALFHARVEALAEASGHPAAFRDAVHLAAMAGQSIPRGLLDVVAEAEIEPSLRGSRLWIETDERLRFDHGLLYQAVRAQALARDDVAALHERLARAWIAFSEASGEDHDLEVGRHAHAAGAWKLAVEYLLRAASSAWMRGRTRDLEEAAELAVDACNVDKRIRWRAGWARLWLARVAQLQGDTQEAAERFFQAHQIFVHTDDDEGRVQGLLGMGWASVRVGRFDRGERRYREALDLAQARGDRVSEIRTLRELAWLERQKRNFEGCDILYTRAMARSARSEDVHGVAAALVGRAGVARRTGRFDEALELYAEAEQTAREVDDLLLVARVRHGQGVTRWQRRDLEHAEPLLREARTLAEELGAVQILGQCATALADVLRCRGNRERAQQIYMQHLRQSQRRRALEDVVLSSLGLALISLLDRDLQNMRRHAFRAHRFLDTVPGHWLWARFRLVGATLYAMSGDGDAVWRWVWTAQDLGLDDTVDRDVAFLLTVICNRASQEGWDNALRAAGHLALSQWTRLGRDKERVRVEEMMRAKLGTAAPPPRR